MGVQAPQQIGSVAQLDPGRLTQLKRGQPRGLNFFQLDDIALGQAQLLAQLSEGFIRHQGGDDIGPVLGDQFRGWLVNQVGVLD